MKVEKELGLFQMSSLRIEKLRKKQIEIKIW